MNGTEDGRDGARSGAVVADHRGKSMLRIFGCAMVLAMSACASTRATVPPAMTGAPDFKYPGLHASAFGIVVEDVRSDRAESDVLTKRVRSDLASALTRGGVPVSPGAPLTLRVRVVKYGADFELAKWKGCAAFESRFLGGSVDPPMEPVERCASRFNTFGAGTRDDVLAEAYGQAIADVLRHLDDVPAPKVLVPPEADSGLPASVPATQH